MKNYFLNVCACLCMTFCLASCERDPQYQLISSVTTLDAKNVSAYSATLWGEFEVSSYGGKQARYCAFRISTSPNFDTADTEYTPEKSCDDNIGSNYFLHTIENLKENTTYYYYAYLKKYSGVMLKGEVKSFTTEQIVAPQGAIKGLFSVSNTKKVFFSKGNLQYQASTAKWRFAEQQYNYIGAANSNISATYSGWIDLFGWGTSGYNNRYPYLSSTNYADYILWSSIAGTNYDWGVYDAISNGGNQAGKWRTLTDDEWNYLRTNGCSGRSQATVCGVKGYILTPLSFNKPDGVSWTPISGIWGTNSYSTNIYDASSWKKMEDAGAVFLPAAGRRSGTSVSLVEEEGRYWTSTRYSGEGPEQQKFTNTSYMSSYYFYYSYGYYGCSVRLVQDYQ